MATFPSRGFSTPFPKDISSQSGAPVVSGCGRACKQNCPVPHRVVILRLGTRANYWFAVEEYVILINGNVSAILYARIVVKIGQCLLVRYFWGRFGFRYPLSKECISVMLPPWAILERVELWSSFRRMVRLIFAILEGVGVTG